jgi:hypothetical protein
VVDAYHVPKLLSQQLLPFGRSGDGLERLTFEVELVSALFATCVFFPCSCSALLSILRGFEFSLGKVSDSPQQRADGPRVPSGQSACSPRTVHYSGSSMEMLLASTDGPRLRPDSPQQGCGQSAAPCRTVCAAITDSPRCLAGRSARGCQLCFLVRFLPSFLVLPRVLQGIVPKTRG